MLAVACSAPPEGRRPGQSVSPVDRLVITLLVGATASPAVNVRPCSGLIAITPK
jgi:hypothetical protein